MRNVEKTRARTLVNLIYELFASKKKIKAKEALAKLEGKGSVPTIIKARKLLGVKSTKIAGQWCWLYPQFTPEVALGRGEKIIYRCLSLNCIDPEVGKPRFEAPKDQRRIRCPFCGGKNVVRTKSRNRDVEYLERTMRMGKYDLPAKKVLHALRRHLKSKIYSAKKELGISQYRDEEGIYRWVLVAEEVTDWLYDLLEVHRGKIEDSLVYSLALKEKGWKSHILLEKARIHLGNIKTAKIKDVRYWLDRERFRNIPSADDWKPGVPKEAAVKIPDIWLPAKPRLRMDRMRFLWETVAMAGDVETRLKALGNFKYYKSQMQRFYPEEIRYWEGEKESPLPEIKAAEPLRPVKPLRKKAEVDGLETVLED